MIMSHSYYRRLSGKEIGRTRNEEGEEFGVTLEVRNDNLSAERVEVDQRSNLEYTCIVALLTHTGGLWRRGASSRVAKLCVLKIKYKQHSSTLADVVKSDQSRADTAIRMWTARRAASKSAITFISKHLMLNLIPPLNHSAATHHNVRHGRGSRM